MMWQPEFPLIAFQSRQTSVNIGNFNKNQTSGCESLFYQANNFFWIQHVFQHVEKGNDVKLTIFFQEICNIVTLPVYFWIIFLQKRNGIPRFFNTPNFKMLPLKIDGGLT